MYRDYIKQIQAIDNFGIACGIIVYIGCMDAEELLEHMRYSNIVSKLIDGHPVYSTSSAVAMAIALAQESGHTEFNEKIFDAHYNRTHDSYGLWLGKTELEIAIRSNKTISELREMVSTEQHMINYVMYHMFYRPDRLIKEQYHLKEVSA